MNGHMQETVIIIAIENKYGNINVNRIKTIDNICNM
jgi:hypothetical protein